MRVLMVGKTPSMALGTLRKYWGMVHYAKPPLIRPGKYDLIVAQEPTLRTGLPALLLAKLTATPLFTEVHADYLPHLNLIQRAIAYRVLKSSNLVRAVNKTITRQLNQIGISKTATIPSIYIDPKTFHPTKKHSQRSKTILFISRLTHQKGLDLLLDSYKIIVEKTPDTELLIVGRGPLKPWLIEEIRSANLTGHVKLYDWAPQSMLVNLYNEAAILACTSRYEGGPRVVFEAAACETPSVSTRVGIIPEALQDGVEVCLVDRDPEQIAEAAVKLLKDPELRQRMGEAARQKTLQLFSWEEAVKRYAETYIKAAKNKEKQLVL
jgi:glycosyltransferase involved in cell wall biosynthesis